MKRVLPILAFVLAGMMAVCGGCAEEDDFFGSAGKRGKPGGNLSGDPSPKPSASGISGGIR